MNVLWLSGGVSSFIAGYLFEGNIDKVIYIDIDDQHPDTMRFVNECADYLKKPVEILKSRYGSVDNVCKAVQFIKSPYGAPCTNILKRRVRKEWEEKQAEKLTYIWGMDCGEKDRAYRLYDTMPDCEHIFPLIDKVITKQDAHGILAQLGIKRPAMYDMGYQNNNCIGCVKGGMWYWNKIRTDFPQVFKQRAEMERDMGHSILKDDKGMVFLDELDPNRGRKEDEISQQCGIYCMLNV